jgi:dihydroorotase
MTIDLILRGGRIIDPSQHLDTIMDIGFADGKVAAVSAYLAADTDPEILDVSGHVYRSNSQGRQAC